MEEWRVNVSSTPHNGEEEWLLVEWSCGQGLTVLPQPPLLNNNYLNYLVEILMVVDETREDGKIKQGGNTWISPP